MTTLAIIGSGIAGRSLIYALAKEKKEYQRIVLFSSDDFVFPCTLHSTAIVAPRGLTSGKSPLGDLLLAGFQTFSQHVVQDKPMGVEEVSQITGATLKLDEFKKRYPHANFQKKFLKESCWIAEDKAYAIEPRVYGEWLIKEASALKLEMISDFVVEINDGGKSNVQVKTSNGQTETFDKVVFAGGNYNRFWKELAPGSKLQSSQAVQGSYLEFKDAELNLPSLSLTLDGDNFIWDEKLKRLLIGSTTAKTHHLLAPVEELKDIYQRLSHALDCSIPDFTRAQIRVGLREKAPQRAPYLFENQSKVFFGGLYKNGFTLSLKMSRDLISQFL